MFISLLVLFFILLVIAMFIHSRRNGYIDSFDDSEEEETVTTTTVTTTTTVDDPAPQYSAPQPAVAEYVIVGDLKRKKARNGQLYVIDPVDKDKIFVNPTDDLYEDGAGKIWRMT